MGEQAVDLRSTLSTFRRHRGVLAGAAVLGAAAGLSFVLINPPMYSSTSEVLLPQIEDSSGETVAPDVQTQVRVAGSDVVLDPVAKSLDEPMSTRELAKRVTISAPTTNVVQFRASATTRTAAQKMARDLAHSEVNHLEDDASSLTNAEQAALTQREESLKSSLETVNAEIKKTTTRKRSELAGSTEEKADASALAQLTAQQASLVLQIDQVKDQIVGGGSATGAEIIQDASPAERPGLVRRVGVVTVLGVLAAVTIAASVLAMFGRRDRRLRYRDELADALGSPVIASVRSQVPRTVAGWKSLLGSYAPETVDAWALRQTLRQLVFDERDVPSSHDTTDATVDHPASLTVLTLSDDPRGLAIGPQIASYAASTRIRTQLVAFQQHDSASALWAACQVHGEEIRPNLVVDTHPGSATYDLTVVLVVVDRRSPEIAELPETSATVLIVSSGTATAEDVARVAVTADDAGSQIDGIVVADPDSFDRTTGRLLQPERAHQTPLPTHLTGMTPHKSGVADVLDLRRRSQ